MNTYIIPAAPAISSIDIADLTGKRHSDVIRDIRKTLEQAEITERKFAASYKDASGKENPCYYLPRFECDLVISGYSVPYRAAIIRRWHELEAEKSKVLPAPTRREQLERELAEIDRGEIGSGIIDAIRPLHEYGSRTASGVKRVGIRRAAWVATRRSRLEDALEIHRELRALDQTELALGLNEGGQP